MRNQTTWEEQILPIVMKEFTPRIQKDLQTIPFPDNLPKDPQSTFIYGLAGHGKTLYAVFLYLQARRKMYLEDIPGTAVFISVTDLLSRLRLSYDSSERDHTSKLDIYLKAHVLVLDDFGVTKPTDWAVETLYTIINHRYEQLLTTIITSNKSLLELAIVFSDVRITSRIERMGQIVKKEHYGRREH